MGHANGIITAPVNTDDISATLGVASHDVATLCISQKVNKRSRFKPYPIGSYNTELTDELLRQNNFCMRPACVEHVYGGNVGDYRAMPWKQWTPPKVGQHWMRMLDFDRYYHFSKGGIYSARISTNNPNGDRRIMLGGRGKGRITGDIEFNFDTSREVCPHEFTHPDQADASLAGYRFTLLFGGVEGVSDSFSAAPWVAQSNMSISEMISGGSTYERLQILLDRDRTSEITGSEFDLDKWLAVLCLAPPIVTNDDGKYVKVEDDAWASTSLDFSNMRLVSLDMWDDGSIKTDSVLFSRIEDMDEYTIPAQIKTVEIGASASYSYLTTPASEYVPFECHMHGWAYRSGSGHRLALTCSPFPPVYLPGNSVIDSLAHDLYYDLYNSSGQLVFRGKTRVSEVRGSIYNPTHSIYNIGFEEGLEEYDTALPALPAGKYRLRMWSVASQIEDDINYAPEPPERQVMGELSWEYEEDEYVPLVDGSGSVSTSITEKEITIS